MQENIYFFFFLFFFLLVDTKGIQRIIQAKVKFTFSVYKLLT